MKVKPKNGKSRRLSRIRYSVVLRRRETRSQVKHSLGEWEKFIDPTRKSRNRIYSGYRHHNPVLHRYQTDSFKEVIFLITDQ